MGNAHGSEFGASQAPWRCGATTTPRGGDDFDAFLSDECDYDSNGDDATIGAYTPVDLVSSGSMMSSGGGGGGAHANSSTLRRSKTLPARLVRSRRARAAAQHNAHAVRPRAVKFTPDRPLVVNLRGSPRHRNNIFASSQYDAHFNGAVAAAGAGIGAMATTEDDDLTTRTTPDSGLSEGNPHAVYAMRQPPLRRHCPQSSSSTAAAGCTSLLPGKSNLSDSGCDSGEESLPSAHITPTTGPPNIHTTGSAAMPTPQCISAVTTTTTVEEAAATASAGKRRLEQSASVASHDIVYTKWCRSNRVGARSTAQQPPAVREQQRLKAAAEAVELGCGDRARLLADFTAQLPDEISVRRGDIMLIMRNQKTWLWAQDRHGLQGFVPSASCRLYVSPEDSSETYGRRGAAVALDAAAALPPAHSSQPSNAGSACSGHSAGGTLHRNDSLKASVSSSADTRHALMPEYAQWCVARRRNRSHQHQHQQHDQHQQRRHAARQRSRSSSDASCHRPPTDADTETTAASYTTGSESTLLAAGFCSAPVLGEMTVTVTNAPRISAITPTDATSMDGRGGGGGGGGCGLQEQERVARQNAVERRRQLSELRRLLSLSARRDEQNEEKELLVMPPVNLLKVRRPGGNGAGPKRTPSPVAPGAALGVSTGGEKSTEGNGPLYLSITNLMLHTQMANPKAGGGGGDEHHRRVLPGHRHARDLRLHLPEGEESGAMAVSGRAPWGRMSRSTGNTSLHYGPSRSVAAKLSRHRSGSRPAHMMNGPGARCAGQLKPTSPWQQQHTPTPQSKVGEIKDASNRAWRTAAAQDLAEPSPTGRTSAGARAPRRSRSTATMAASKSHSNSSVGTAAAKPEHRTSPGAVIKAIGHVGASVADDSTGAGCGSPRGDTVRLVCRTAFLATCDWQLPCQLGQWLYTRHKAATPPVGRHDEDGGDGGGKPAVTLDDLTAGKKWIWVCDPYSRNEGLVPADIVALA